MRVGKILTQTKNILEWFYPIGYSNFGISSKSIFEKRSKSAHPNGHVSGLLHQVQEVERFIHSTRNFYLQRRRSQRWFEETVVLLCEEREEKSVGRGLSYEAFRYVELLYQT